MKLLAILLAVVASTAVAQESPTLKLQVLLDRAHFSVGEIDDRAGTNTKSAVKFFQEANKLPATGVADEATLKLLDDGQPILTTHVLTEDDVKGPFGPTPRSMVEKAKLKYLPYNNVLEKLGELFQVSPALLKKLNPAAKFEAGETLTVPAIGGPLTGKITKIVITQSEESLKAYDANGALIAYYPATLGRVGTPAWGEWTIISATHDPWYRYDPKRGFKGGPTVSMIPPGPNNTVGNMWMQLSAPHYGIHGVPSPHNIGKQESEGCTRLTNWDAHEVAAAIDKGVSVTIQR